MARENKLETLKLFLLQAALKTLATILTVTTLIAGLSVAKAADRQAGEAAGGNELINPPTVPSVYAQAGVSHVSSQGSRLPAPGAVNGMLSTDSREWPASRPAISFQRSRDLCPPGWAPKTVLSTRLQYASITFGSPQDSPLVICISGPNPDSVAVRLTII
jgi:hypothetical protein